MSVTAPPRPPRPSGPVDREELEALVEALIEEARQRARRRRRRRGACIVLAALAGGGLYIGLDRSGSSTTGAPSAKAASNGAAAAAPTGERWGVSHGPDGGRAYAVAVAPSAPQDVYLATGLRGVFRSTNGGRSWTSAGLAGFPNAKSLAVDPRSPTTVYAGMSSQYAGSSSHQDVYKTIDGGRAWRALDLRGDPVAISPTAVYAAAGGPRGTSRLVRSTDGGRSWRPADSGLPSTGIWGLAFAPSAPATMYAAMGRRGLFESSDGGVRWRSVGISARYGEVTAIAVDPLHPRTVYAATNAGVVVSHDGGRSWRMLNATIGRHGRRWMQVSALLVDPRDSRTMYASTGCAGVFKSTDGGRRWSAANAGLGPECPWADSLAFDPRAPRTIYAADRMRGVLKSVDGAAHWQVTDKGLGLAPVFSLAADPRSPRTVYAGTGAFGLFKSGDGGVHWRPLATGLKGASEVAVDPSDPAKILVADSTELVDPAPSSPGNAIASSTDGGRSWTKAASGPRWVSVVAISGQTAYAGSSTGYGVFGSTDGGHSWRALGPPGVNPVDALAISPGDPAVVYAGVKNGLYKSTDGGSSWQRLDALNIDVTAVVLDPGNPSTIYVAAVVLDRGNPSTAGGVFKSTDGGTTWQRDKSGLITALAIDPAHPTTLYAATDPGGVFRSTDSGKSWHPFNAGLTDRNITALALNATGRTVYAAAGGGGVVSVRRSP